MPESADEYQSYLLRLWKTSGSDDSPWRASLEDTATGELEGFDSLDSLFVVLRERTLEQGKGATDR